MFLDLSINFNSSGKNSKTSGYDLAQLIQCTFEKETLENYRCEMCNRVGGKPIKTTKLKNTIAIKKIIPTKTTSIKLPSKY